MDFFSNSIYASAAELDTSYSNKDIARRTTPWVIVVDTGTTKNSSTTESFVVAGRVYGLKGYINVSSPCTLFVAIRNRNTGSYLGTASMNVTQSGGYNFNLSPLSLSSGNYELSYWFSNSGISYTFIAKGYTAN